MLLRCIRRLFLFIFGVKLLQFVPHPVDEYLGCFLFSTIRIKAAINIFLRNGNPLQCSCLENPKDRGAW